jgi:hypothetical protein
MEPAASHWIRPRPALAITSQVWHQELTSTPGGVLVTSCAVVLGPEDPIDQTSLGALDDPRMLCPACSMHAGVIDDAVGLAG